VADLYLEGVATSVSWRDTSRSLTELIFETVRSAVDDSGKPMDTIDSVVLSAHDLVDGRSLSSMVTGPAAGAYLRDEIRYGDDGAGAFASAMTRLEAGHNQRTIVAAWGRASEHDVHAFGHSLFDPFFGGPVGLDEQAVSAMRAQSWLQRYDPADRDRASAARWRRAGAARASVPAREQLPAPHPLRQDDLPNWADVVVGLVMSTEPSGVRVSGMGQSSEPYHIGDRDLLGMPALSDAVGKALAEAGLQLDDLDLTEIDAYTGFDEAIAVEALGLAAPGQGFAYIADTPSFNPSGGSAAGYCAPAMGLARIAEAALQIRGTAGTSQVPDVRRALATGSSTIASQTQTAVVLEAS
jgi:acetyl-CoA acetyltransferase